MHCIFCPKANPCLADFTIFGDSMKKAILSKAYPVDDWKLSGWNLWKSYKTVRLDTVATTRKNELD